MAIVTGLPSAMTYYHSYFPYFVVTSIIAQLSNRTVAIAFPSLNMPVENRQAALHYPLLRLRFVKASARSLREISLMSVEGGILASELANNVLRCGGGGGRFSVV